jgi:hypothetical protein
VSRVQRQVEDSAAAQNFKQLSDALDQLRYAHPLLDGNLFENVGVGKEPTTIYHGLNRPVRGILQVKGDCVVEPVITYSDSKKVTFRAPPQWEEIAYKAVTADSRSIEITGLNGDVDYEYKLAGKIKNPDGATREYGFRPNGDSIGSTESDGQKFASSNGTSTSSDPGGMMFAYFSWDEGWFEVHMCAATGQFRQFNVVGCSGDDPGTVDTAIHNYCGTWSDSSTNITSIMVYASSTTAIGDGSWFRLMRKPLSGKASFWVF